METTRPIGRHQPRTVGLQSRRRFPARLGPPIHTQSLWADPAPRCTHNRIEGEPGSSVDPARYRAPGSCRSRAALIRASGVPARPVERQSSCRTPGLSPCVEPSGNSTRGATTRLLSSMKSKGVSVSPIFRHGVLPVELAGALALDLATYYPVALDQTSAKRVQRVPPWRGDGVVGWAVHPDALLVVELPSRHFNRSKGGTVRWGRQCRRSGVNTRRMSRNRCVRAIGRGGTSTTTAMTWQPSCWHGKCVQTFVQGWAGRPTSERTGNHGRQPNQ